MHQLLVGGLKSFFKNHKGHRVPHPSVNVAPHGTRHNVVANDAFNRTESYIESGRNMVDMCRRAHGNCSVHVHIA